MTREEHLQWCKDQALAYLKENNVKDAIASMISDMTKHPGTAGYPSMLNQLGLMYVLQNDNEGARRWIEGFN